MATQTHRITTTPVNIVTELSLESGTKYIVQNTGSEKISLVESASTPDASDNGHIIPVTKAALVEIDTVEGIYLWCRRIGSSVAITEVE